MVEEYKVLTLRRRNSAPAVPISPKRLDEATFSACDTLRKAGASFPVENGSSATQGFEHDKIAWPGTVRGW